MRDPHHELLTVERTRILGEVERPCSVVEELESMVSANLQRATRLRQSILQKEAEVERRLRVVEELEAVVSANLQGTTCLRQSILQKPSSETWS